MKTTQCNRWLLTVLFMWGCSCAAQELKFDFGKGQAPEGFVKVLPQTIYQPDRGYGIDLGSFAIANTLTGAAPVTDGFLTNNRPFYFSVDLPQGNYDVDIWVGDDYGNSDVSVRAECRRMFVNRVQTRDGQHQQLSFTVNIRDSLLDGGKTSVALKDKEYKYLHWDHKLTLEFNGPAPKVNAIRIRPNREAVSVFLAGNSTVVDGAYEPYSAWGQMFPYFFQPGKVSIVNLAESGLTLSGFIYAKRLRKLLTMMRPGDYAFIEFGHNDQKQHGPGIGAFTSFSKNLKYFVDVVRKKGGIPVLVTSVQRRRFDDQGRIEESLGDYPAAVRKAAHDLKVALIDLNALSKTMLEAMGPENSLLVYAHFPAGSFPGKDQPIADNTHFRPFGAYEIAQLVLTGLRRTHLELNQFIKPDAPIFDPEKPDAYEGFYWPESPGKDATKPDGQ
ncbi:rhamnogalacturonan acetylesterase [Niabella terrae]